MKKKKGFTLVELVAVLVILAVIALIATPLVLALIKNSKASTNKRSIDAYGKAVEIAVSNYLVDKGKYPADLSTLEVEYTGREVVCKMMQLNKDGSIYLSRCSVGGVEVKDAKDASGWYSYGKQGEAEEEKDSNTVPDGPGVTSLIAKANDISMTTYDENSSVKHEMYTFAHNETTQTGALKDYRYIGNDPYNYVEFNDELWRIIGVFTVEDENGKTARRIKIIRDELIERLPWDYSNYEEEWNSYEGGKNDWITAKLNTYLNGEYFESLSSDAKALVSPAKYYLGGILDINDMGAVQYYEYERGDMVTPNEREISWTGNIGLMYPSDYIYTYANGVDEVCFKYSNECGGSYWDEENETDIESEATNGWMYIPEDDNNYYQWTISSRFDSEDSIHSIQSSGYMGTDSPNYSDGQARPIVYLNSNVKITEGNGSKDKPYKLAI